MAVMADLKSSGVKIYTFPSDEDGDGKVDKGNMYPLAVMGSRELVQVGKKMVRGRKYPWGTVEGEKC